MNKTEFISLIEHPKNLDKSHVTDLKNIVADFPYFQASHMMLSKALFNENHYEFEKQLRSTALIVSDRELLYRFLHDIQPQEIIGEPNFVHNVEQEIKDIIEVTNQPPLEEHLVERIVNDQIELTETIESPIEEIQLEIISPIKEDTKLSFTEWLLLDKGKIKEENIKAESIDIHEETEKMEPVKSSTNIHEFESILDKFIRENPSISRPKAEFYNPANMAKQSNEDDDDLVTETLANIYYKQGAYKKAIRTYEKLCLIYPHKMSYFADLIQKIKLENKND